MFEKRPPTIETVKGVLKDGPVKLRFAEDTKPWLLDAMTASAMTVIYDALSDENKVKIDGMIRTKAGMMKYINFCWKNVKT